MNIFKMMVLGLVAAFGHIAVAQGAGSKAFSGALGFFGSNVGTIVEDSSQRTTNLSGVFGLGGDFEYFMADDFSLGAIFRYYNTSDDIGTTEYTNSLLTLGGIARAYLAETPSWSLIGTGGLGVLEAEVKTKPQGGTSETVDSGMRIGLYMGVTVLYKLNSKTRLGVENMRILGLGERLNGWVLSDYMAKVMFIF